MGRALSIRDDRSTADLRLLARRERDGRVAGRLYAIADALDGMTRADRGAVGRDGAPGAQGRGGPLQCRGSGVEGPSEGACAAHAERRRGGGLRGGDLPGRRQGARSSGSKSSNVTDSWRELPGTGKAVVAHV